MPDEEVTPAAKPSKPVSDATRFRQAIDMLMKYLPLIATALATIAGSLAIVNKNASDQRTNAVEQKVENKGAQVLQAVKETVAPTVKKTLSTEERLTQLEELVQDIAKKSSPERRKKLIAKVEKNTATKTLPIKPLPVTLPPVTSAPPETPSP